MTEYQRLSDIVPKNDSTLQALLDNAKAAEEFSPLPGGIYQADCVGGKMAESMRGTPSCKFEFRVTQGEFLGRRFWHDLWLTDRAITYTKRDLKKFDITNFSHFDHPWPGEYHCEVKLALRQRDDGNQYNEVKSFEVKGFTKFKADPFAPSNGRGTA